MKAFMVWVSEAFFQAASSWSSSNLFWALLCIYLPDIDPNTAEKQLWFLFSQLPANTPPHPPQPKNILPTFMPNPKKRIALRHLLVIRAGLLHDPGLST
jgi:hypothetical protein